MLRRDYPVFQVTGWEGELEEGDSLQEQVGMDSLQAVEFRRILCSQVYSVNFNQYIFFSSRSGFPALSLWL